jgi:predicted Zn finger-like uncharacterized protein
MAIKTSCPNCSQSYTLADTQLGKKVRCKNCSEAFTVREGKPPRLRDEDDDRPAPRPKKKGGVPTGLLIGGIAALLLLLVCLGGAGAIVWWATGALRSTVTEENYAKLKMGMSEAEVKAVLGEPTEGQGGAQVAGLGMKSLAWRNGPNQIVVTFLNGKVVGLSGHFRKSGGAAPITSNMK